MKIVCNFTLGKSLSDSLVTKDSWKYRHFNILKFIIVLFKVSYYSSNLFTILVEDLDKTLLKKNIFCKTQISCIILFRLQHPRLSMNFFILQTKWWRNITLKTLAEAPDKIYTKISLESRAVLFFSHVT